MAVRRGLVLQHGRGVFSTFLSKVGGIQCGMPPPPKENGIRWGRGKAAVGEAKKNREAERDIAPKYDCSFLQVKDQTKIV